MKNLILCLIVFLLSMSGFAQLTPQPKPIRVPRHQRPNKVNEPSTDPAYVPLDATIAPCQLTVENAPTISGVKLGLTADELGKAFKIKIIPGALNHLEVSTFSIGEQNKSALPKGINAINLAFFNNRLFHAVIAFDNASQPKTLDKFALALSEKHNFSKAWFRTAVENYVYLFCPGELRVELTINDDVQLRMLDLKADTQKMQKRKQNNSSKPQ